MLSAFPLKPQSPDQGRGSFNESGNVPVNPFNSEPHLYIAELHNAPFGNNEKSH
jgi:hypothetical protein